jgi:serine/threonine-protein kinase
MVVVYDIGEDQGTVYIAMEFLEGSPLNEIIQNKTLTTLEIIELGVQVADALDYAHRRGIVHRDIKPSNIIVQPDGRVKITDFGIAHIENPDATHQTQAGEILGTPAYMSPEQVLGRPVDGRSDLFSLGVILYEMAVGKRPFRGENIATIFQGITNQEPLDPVGMNPAVPGELSRVIMKCLAKDPDSRFSTGRELSQALRLCGGEDPSAATIVRPFQRSAKKRRLPMAVSLALLVLLVAGFSYYFASRRTLHDTSPPISDQGPSKDDVGRMPPTDLTTPKIEPQPPDVSSPLGTLRVVTTPVGAQVLVDGQSRGLTPLDIRLPIGYHEVQLTLADYGDWAAQVKVTEDKVTSIPVELLPMNRKNP